MTFVKNNPFLLWSAYCVLIKQCRVTPCFQSAIVYSKSTDQVKTHLCRLLFKHYFVDFVHVLAVCVMIDRSLIGFISFYVI